MPSFNQSLQEWWKNIKPEHHHKMTRQEWDRTPKDYKEIKPDGTMVVMHLDEKGRTTLSPVVITN